MQNKKKDFLDLALESQMLVAPNVEPSVQPQPMIMIEGAPPDFKYSTTGEYSFGPGDNENLKPQALYQSNIDKAFGKFIDPELALATSREASALAQAEKSRQQRQEAIQSLAQRPVNDASAIIRDMRSASASKPQEFKVPEEDL